MRAAVQLILIAVVLAACNPAPSGQQAAPNAEPEGGAQASEEATQQDSEDLDEATLVTDPPADSPEAVIRGILEGAMNPDEAAGWETTKALLHSNLHTNRALKSYRELNFPASRRKVALFTPDDTKPHFRVAKRKTPAPDKIKLFIHNEKSMPTPCTLKKDAKADGAWRVHACSL